MVRLLPRLASARLAGTIAVSLDVAVTVRFVAGVSGSLTVNPMAAVETSSLVLWEPIADMVGGSFTGLTVRVKVLLELKLPSETMIVMLAVPKRFVAGTMDTVREPPRFYAQATTLHDRPHAIHLSPKRILVP